MGSRGQFCVEGAAGGVGAAFESRDGGVENKLELGVRVGVASGAGEPLGGTGPISVLVSPLAVGAGAVAGVSPVGVEAVNCK